jgi:hypothetical protein
MANLSNINNVLRVSTNLRVGINTDAASYALEIGGTNSGIKLKNSGASGKVYSLLSDTSGNFQIYDDAATSGRLVISSGGDATFAGSVTTTGAMTVGDDVIVAGNITLVDKSSSEVGSILLGSGNDLQIYHNGSDSFVSDSGTGDLILRSNSTAIIKSANTKIEAFGSTNTQANFGNTAVELYSNNVKRLETEDAGVTIIGALNADSVTSTGSATFGANVIVGDTSGTSPNSADRFLKIGKSDLQDCSIILQDAVETWEIYQNDDLSFSYGTTPTTVLTLARTTGTATFSGSVAISHSSGDSLILTKTTTEPSLRIEGDSGKDFVITVSGELLTFTQNDGGTDILTLDHDTKNATFASNVTLSSGFVNVPAGAVGTPSLIFAGDDDTGLWHPASNTLAFSTFGSERMRIDSSGNVGIGISPSASFSGVEVLQLGKGMTLMGNANDDRASMMANLYLDSNTAFRYVMDGLAGKVSIEDGIITFGTAPSGIAGEVATVTERMRITSGGNVNIGSGGLTQAAYHLRVDSDFDNGIYLSAGTGSSDHALYIDNAAGDKVLLTIRGDGYFNVGNAANSPYNVSVVGRDAYISSAGYLGYLSSTRKSKTNIKSIDNVDWLYNLNVVKFNYRKRNEELDYLEEAENEQKYGLIAEEVEKVNKDFCWYSKDNNLEGVDYKMLIAPLIKSIQELKAEIEILKNK